MRRSFIFQSILSCQWLWYLSVWHWCYLVFAGDRFRRFAAPSCVGGTPIGHRLRWQVWQASLVRDSAALGCPLIICVLMGGERTALVPRICLSCVSNEQSIGVQYCESLPIAVVGCIVELLCTNWIINRIGVKHIPIDFYHVQQTNEGTFQFFSSNVK